MTPTLYPKPTRYRTRNDSCDLRGRRYIRLPANASNRLGQAAVRIAHSLPFTADMTHGQPGPDATLVTLVRERGKGEGYQLDCQPGGITLSSPSEAGLFYGLLTLKQMLEQSGEHLPCCLINDAPDFSQRGVMLDISRCKVPTLATLETLIDQLAGLKINQLQLYTEHTFAFSNHEPVWADASPLTAGDLLRLKAYCQARFIDLVPNLNSFGHFERWLRHPGYKDLAECPDGFAHPLTGNRLPYGSTLRPNRKSLTLLAELFDEYLPLFDSQFFNIGGDEPWELGEGWSRRRCEQLGGATPVYIEFLSRIKQLVDKRDRTMMFWSDIVLKQPDSVRKLSRDLVAMNWGYEARHPFKAECDIMGDARVPFYVCPGTSSWNSLTGRIGNATANLASAARHGLATGAKGYLVTDWGDHGHHQYLPISYPGFMMAACQAWNHRGAGKLDMIDGVNRHFFNDPASHGGQLLWGLGQVLELAPSKLANATIFNHLLFSPLAAETRTSAAISLAQLQACQEQFDDLQTQLPRLNGNDENLLVRDELGNAIAMARLGLQRLAWFRRGGSSPKPLERALQAIIAEHHRLWLARNRPGGLPESVNHLRQSARLWRA